MWVSRETGEGACSRAVNDVDVLLLAQAELHAALDQLLLASLAQSVGVAYTCAPLVSHCALLLLQEHPTGLPLPELRHKILKWLPVSGRARAKTVGAKNIASSSGCAIRRQIRLFSRAGRRGVASGTRYMYNTGATATERAPRSRTEPIFFFLFGPQSCDSVFLVRSGL